LLPHGQFSKTLGPACEILLCHLPLGPLKSALALGHEKATRMSARLSVDEEEFAYKTISVTPLNPLIGAGVEVAGRQATSNSRRSLGHRSTITFSCFANRRIAPDERKTHSGEQQLQPN